MCGVLTMGWWLLLLLQSVASDWVGRYQDDPCPAMAELVQFFFTSSGCKGQVDVEAFDDLDIASTTEELSAPENFSEVCSAFV